MSIMKLKNGKYRVLVRRVVDGTKKVLDRRVAIFSRLVW